MKKFHPFFSIGTIGMIVLAFLHIFLTVGLSLNGVHSSFFVMYPVFLSFLMIGFALTLKKKKTVLVK